MRLSGPQITMSSKEIGGDGVFMLVISGVILVGKGIGGSIGGRSGCGGGKTCGAVPDCCVVFGGTRGTIIAGLGLSVGIVVVCGVKGI